MSLAIAGLALLASCSTYPGSTPAKLEYRWDGEPSFRPYEGQRLLAPQGNPDIHVRITGATPLQADDAIALSEDGSVVSVQQEGVPLVRGKLSVYLLKSSASPVEARFRVKRVRFGPIDARFGPSVRLVDSIVEDHLAATLASLALALVGLALCAVGLMRSYARGYAWLGLFALAVGTLYLALNPFRLFLFPWVRDWSYVLSICVFGELIACGRFFVAMLGKDRFLHLGTLSAAGALVVAIGLDLAGIAPLATSRTVAYYMSVAGMLRIVWLVVTRSIRGEQQAKNLLALILIQIVFAMPDLFGAIGWIPPLPLFAEYGVLASILVLVPLLERGYETQRITLEQTRSALVKRVDELTAQGSEIRALNTELRHQVAEHSRQLGRMFVSDGNMSVAHIDEGALFADRYFLVRRLGAGGMGEVFETERTSDKKRFALKVMLRVASPIEAARFAREAEISASFDHANLVSVFDAGIFQGRLFLVMELIHGGGLDNHAERYGDAPWALKILEHVALGLSALHAHGVVHRDLKPGNVLLSTTSEGLLCAKISDFGIARSASPTSSSLDSGLEYAATVAPEQLDATAPTNAELARTELPDAAGQPAKKIRLTATGGLIGTPLYMPPEAATARRDVGTEGDIYAFGVLAFELLEGRLPFATPPVILAMVGAAIPEPATIANPAVSARITSLLAHCLDIEPSRRPTAEQLCQALQSATGARVEHARATPIDKR